MIDIQGLSLSYSGRQGPVHALRGIDLRIQSGEVFGIIGRSGAGKSSLVRTINLLNRPTAGRVEVAGRELTTLTAAELRAARQDIGMVFQHFNLLSSRTVAGNVALPLELAGVPQAEIEARIQPLLELVGLAQLADRYPAQISGGQKQRVGIARALASRPKVLLSDEATSALDPETTRAILDLLRDVNRRLGVTIVLITHQMQVIKQIADRVAVIDGGRIVEMGPVLDVFTRPQHPTTRSLIEEILPASLPESVLQQARGIAAQLPPGVYAHLLRVSYGGEAANAPVWSEVASLGVQVNVLHGVIDEIQRQPFGMLAVLLCGADHDLQAAAAHLTTRGYTWTSVQETVTPPGSGADWWANTRLPRDPDEKTIYV
ncbi:phosphate ABC transporter ATP-binding protein [Comamonas serinivorans]|uniref:Cell division ATP-binding protein FtsE n=1 Tax=Comamonas serinivorans TaxID=1082851 RepID=A0A1Y0ELG8_9BURK|nr:methionine ABC transporter ATP-binding protein [Comamonas serinivorans]ARU04495.1 phosphate ABC transporter ATP-binding protein [Comamonas serinivorans]